MTDPLIDVVRQAQAEGSSTKFGRAMNKANELRDRRWSNTPAELRLDGPSIPPRPFGDRRCVVVCARFEDRPEREYKYHYWTDQWVMPLTDKELRRFGL